MSRDRSSVTVNNKDHCQYFRKYFRLDVLLAWILADRIDRQEFMKCIKILMNLFFHPTLFSKNHSYETLNVAFNKWRVLELATRKQTLLGLSLFFRDKKEDLEGSYGSSDYMNVLQSEVDKFFNQEMQSKSKETDLVPTSQVR